MSFNIIPLPPSDVAPHQFYVDPTWHLEYEAALRNEAEHRREAGREATAELPQVREQLHTGYYALGFILGLLLVLGLANC